MKKLIIASVVAAFSGLGLAPQTAQAGNNEVWAALGGFVGGVIVGSTLDNDCDSAVVVEARYGHHNHHGYWKVVSVRTWIPGRWAVRYDDCGRRYREFHRGHYAWTDRRVWVDGRRDRQYGYSDRRDRPDRRG